MNSLERAKALLANTGKGLAITILPLAAAAVPAQASSINMPTLTTVCGFSEPSDVVAVGNGVQYSFGATNCGSGGAYLYSSGGATGMITGNTFPVSWNFGVNGGPGEAWQVEVFMPNSGTVVFDQTGVVPPGGGTVDISGSGTATVGSSGGSGYAVYFEVGIPSGGAVTLNSLDLNATSAPEPEALWLVVPGLGLLLLKRRKPAPRA